MRSVKSILYHHLPHLQQKIISSQQAQIQIRFQGQKQTGGEPIQIELFILNKIVHVVKLVAICPAAGHSLK